MGYVPFAKSIGEEQVIRMLEDSFFTSKEYDKKQGRGTFTSYFYKVDFFGNDSTLRDELSPDKDGWAFSATGLVADLIQQVHSKAGDTFYIKHGGKEGNKIVKAEVYHLQGNEWVQIHKQSSQGGPAGPGSAAPAQGEPTYDYNDPQGTNPKPDTQAAERPNRVEGWMISAFMVSSTIAGLCHPSARKVPITAGQFTSLMIATAGLYGGKFAENWKNIDCRFILRDIERAEKMIAKHGVPKHLQQILPDLPQAGNDKDADPRASRGKARTRARREAREAET